MLESKNNTQESRHVKAGIHDGGVWVRRCRSSHRRFAVVEANTTTSGPRMTISGVTRRIPSLYSPMSTNSRTLSLSEPSLPERPNVSPLRPIWDCAHPQVAVIPSAAPAPARDPKACQLSRIFRSPAPSSTSYIES
jgi:hypothetical protein